MGHPRTKALALAQSRSRFCEGSMNDRVSAAPPTQFLDPADRAALEQPVSLPISSSISSATAARNSTSDDGDEGHQTLPRKTGSWFLGQVWDGVRGRLRLRKDSDEEATKGPLQTAALAATKQDTPRKKDESRPVSSEVAADVPAGARVKNTRTSQKDNSDAQKISLRRVTTEESAEFASREEVLASYQQLVADGFFKSHAIQSSRMPARNPGPPPSRPPPAPPSPSKNTRSVADRPATATRPSTAHGNRTVSHTIADSGTPPNWPLAPTHQAPPPPTPNPTRLSSPVRSPASASSRGTKRAAMHSSENDDSDQDEDRENQDPQRLNVKEVATTHQRKLRKVASGERFFMPKLRNVSSRRQAAAAGRRSISATDASSPFSTNREHNKLTKRAPAPRAAGRFSSLNATVTGSMRQISSSATRTRDTDAAAATTHRVLRSAAAARSGREPHSVLPDSRRGIPDVPAIPPKFTYGEDRENDGPWRGLRLR